MNSKNLQKKIITAAAVAGLLTGVNSWAEAEREDQKKPRSGIKTKAEGHGHDTKKGESKKGESKKASKNGKKSHSNGCSNGCPNGCEHNTDKR